MQQPSRLVETRCRAALQRVYGNTCVTLSIGRFAGESNGARATVVTTQEFPTDASKALSHRRSLSDQAHGLWPAVQQPRGGHQIESRVLVNSRHGGAASGTERGEAGVGAPSILQRGVCSVHLE